MTDKRFSHAAWEQNAFAKAQAAAYLQWSEAASAATQQMLNLSTLTETQKTQWKFATEQTIAAASPANSLFGNAQALQTAIDTEGKSLQAGLANLLNDLRKGRITQTDETAFEIGKTVATTAGSVVFENEFMQLIQYAPSTAKVYAKPLLMVPPCINKYYILDLQPETSFVKYTVEQGHTVFLVSWRNPVGTELNHATWDDYVEHGVLAALLAVHEITGQNDFNTLGFCVGGTLLSVGLAVLAAQGLHVASSMTLLTTLLDFSSPGVLGVFTDENQVAKRETEFAKGGLMLGKDLSQSFSLLRPNDLVWNYVVANYLLGQPAPAFDLLFWNSDSTNVAGPMFAQYLRQLYMNNALAVPDKNKPLKVLKQNVDLSRLVHDTYILANQEDHIVPWQAAHQSSHLLGAAAQNKVRFVQGASGHIAGVINPASKNKRSYRIAPLPTELGESAAVWDATAQTVAGSWWTDWAEWLGERAGKKIAVPKQAGNAKFAKYAVIEPAPGRYVKVSLRG